MSLLLLIDEYMTAVSLCLAKFEERYGRRDLMRAVIEKVIPRKGRLSADFDYGFQGIGCLVTTDAFEVDFDFSNATDVGFDAWRLWLFAEQYPQRYGEFSEKVAVERALAELKADGLIMPCGGRSTLFELTDRGRVRRA